MLEILHQINIVEIVSAFIVMFAIIDITGSIPIFISMEDSGKHIKPLYATSVALGLFLLFFFTGEALPAIERQESFHEMMEIALKTAIS